MTYRQLPFFLFAFYLCTVVVDGHAKDCILDQTDTETEISYVHDGDTVFGKDGQKIRLIGIDTPELARDDKADEPFAKEARDYLRKLLASSRQVKLRYDLQRQDRYQRDLAHLFLANGDNVSTRMLEAGLATALVIPPNLRFADCYLAAQQYARIHKLGIWQLSEFRPIALAEFDPAAVPAYRLITATIKGMQKGRRDDQIRLQDGQQALTLLISGNDRSLFSELINRLLTGQRVLVQGWIIKKHGRLQLHLRHPGFFTLLTDTQ